MNPGAAPHRSEETRAVLNLGLRHLTHERVAEGLAAFQHAIELAPDDADAYAFLAVSQFATGKFDESQVAIERALELAPDGFWPNLKAGELHERLGDLAAAEAEFLRALRAVEPGTKESAAAAAALALTRSRKARSISHRAILPTWRPRLRRRGAAGIGAPLGEA